FRLAYSSGPLSFAISVEDADNATDSETTNVITGFSDTNGNGKQDVGEPNVVSPVTTKTTRDTSDLPNAQAYLMYSSDAFTAQITGLVQDDDFGSMDWAVGGGATVGLADHITLLAAAVVGEGTSSYANNVGPGSADDDFWAASGGLIANLSEDTRLE